mgnify:CR=1 FL=1
MATIKFVLRYKTEQQKKKLEKIADKCGRSANAHILHLIDSNIDLVKQVDIFNKTGKIFYQSGEPAPFAIGIDEMRNVDIGNGKATVIRNSAEDKIDTKHKTKK